MSQGRVAAFEAGELSGWADDGVDLILHLVGSADLRSIEALAAFVRAAEVVAIEDGLVAVTIDLRRLEFMNAVCLRELAAWVSRLQAMPATTRYRLRFVTDPERHWQRMSLPMIKCFGTDLVEVVE